MSREYIIFYIVAILIAAFLIYQAAPKPVSEATLAGIFSAAQLKVQPTVSGEKCTVDGDCDDGDPCTTDSCIGGACYSGTPTPYCRCSNNADCYNWYGSGYYCSWVEGASSTGGTCVPGRPACELINGEEG